METKKKNKKDNTYCCVPQCNSLGSKMPQLSFHKFPNTKSVIYKTTADGRRTEINRRKEWVRTLKIGKDVSNRMSVCSKHFDVSAFTFPPDKCERPRLKFNALPSLHLPKTSTYSEARKSAIEKASEQRLARYNEINRKKTTAAPNISCSSGDIEPSDLITKEREADEVSALQALMCMPNTSRDAQLQMHDTATDAQVFTDDVGEAIGIFPKCHQNIQAEAEKADKGTQVCSGDFKTQHIIKADVLAEKYLHNDLQLKSISGLLSVAFLNFLAAQVSKVLTFSNKHKLPAKERIILSMMRMYLNISFTSLAVFFGCTCKTATNIFNTIIPVLSDIFSIFIEWPLKEEVVANLPKVFSSFEKVRVVLDCTEIIAQQPKCLNERIGMYSHYYKDYTLKYMIAASPSGFISFVSRGYGGRASDKQIFSDSGLIEMLEPHIDAVMTDKGFYIEDMCGKQFIELIRLPFLRKKNQFSKAEALLSRKVASARVHIERAIQRIKLMRIFKGAFPNHLIHMCDSMINIAAGLANLSTPVLADNKFIFNASTDEN